MPLHILELPEQWCLMDTEYTTWPGARERSWSGPGEYREVVQIGALIVDNNLREVASFEAYVKPVRNPVLSEFFIELTGITQQVVEERGTSLLQATQVFARFMGGHLCGSYGRDAEIIAANCELLLRAECPLPPSKCENLRPQIFPLLTSLGVDPTGYSSGTLISAFRPGEEHLRAHDAINDMRNFLYALREIQKRLPR